MTDFPLRLFAAYHKPAYILPGAVYAPVHAGRAVAAETSKDGTLGGSDLAWLCAHMPGDDSGDNISLLNRYFAEITVHYWVWKNYATLGNPEVVGFMHYRRHFIFNEGFTLSPHKRSDKLGRPARPDSFAVVDKPWPGYAEDLFLSQEHAVRVAASCDVIAATPVLLGLTVQQEYLKRLTGLFEVDPASFGIMSEALRHMYPDYVPAMERYFNSKLHYWCHSYIMRKEYFFAYMQWLFPLLMHIHHQFDYTRYSVAGKRVTAFIAERLHGIYLTHLQQQGNVSMGWLPLAFVFNTDPKNDVHREKS